MAHTNPVSIGMLIMVALVAIGGLAAVNINSITGNFQIHQKAPIENLAAYFTYEPISCDDLIADWDARGNPINDPPPTVCLAEFYE